MGRSKAMAFTTNQNRSLMIKFNSIPLGEDIQNGPVAAGPLAYDGEGA
jgi:hypothetical protein